MKGVKGKVVEDVLVVKIHRNWWNPNIQSSAIYEKVKAVIVSDGMKLKDLLKVRKCTAPLCELKDDPDHYELVDGEHRFRALKDLGIRTVSILDLGNISDDEAQRDTLNFNNLRGDDDPLKRAKMYDKMNSNQLALLSFSEKQISEEKDLLNFDFKQFDNVEFKEELINPFIVIVSTAMKLKRQIMSVQENVKDEATWLLCLAIVDGLNKLEEKFLVAKGKIDVKVDPNQTTIFDEIEKHNNVNNI